VTDQPAFDIRPMTDRAQLEGLLRLRWSEASMIIRGRFVRPEDVEGLGAFADGRLLGIATWLSERKFLHLVGINASTQQRGVGIALLNAVIAHARDGGCAAVRASISNDNVVALRFYQKRGFHILAFHRGIIDAMRNFKPSIAVTGLDGIPMRDEIELEYEL
jgi:ribosomal protein S18 acetylase RimI-like enzyme